MKFFSPNSKRALLNYLTHSSEQQLKTTTPFSSSQITMITHTHFRNSISANSIYLSLIFGDITSLRGTWHYVPKKYHHFMCDQPYLSIYLQMRYHCTQFHLLIKPIVFEGISIQFQIQYDKLHYAMHAPILLPNQDVCKTKGIHFFVQPDTYSSIMNG